MVMTPHDLDFFLFIYIVFFLTFFILGSSPPVSCQPYTQPVLTGVALARKEVPHLGWGASSGGYDRTSPFSRVHVTSDFAIAFQEWP